MKNLTRDVFNQKLLGVVVLIAWNFFQTLVCMGETIVTQIPVDNSYMSGVAVNPVTNRIYYVTWVEGIQVLDGYTNTIIGNINPLSTDGNGSGVRTNGIAINSVTNRIYALLPDALVVIDGNTN